MNMSTAKISDLEKLFSTKANQIRKITGGHDARKRALKALPRAELIALKRLYNFAGHSQMSKLAEEAEIEVITKR